MSPRLKRFLITALVVFFGLTIVLVLVKGAGRSATTTHVDPQATQKPTDEQQAAKPPGGDAPSEAPGENEEPRVSDPGAGEQKQVAVPDEGVVAPPSIGLHFKAQDAEALLPLGDLESADNTARLQLEFSPFGAGVSQITLADYYRTRSHDPEDRYTLMDGQWDRRPAMGIRRVYVNGERVEAYDEAAPMQPRWFRQLEAGAFEAVIVDAEGKPVLTITRRFELGQVEGEITIRQEVRNETSEKLGVRIEQWGPGDLPYSQDGYGDFRRVRFGYLDPRSAEVVLASESAYLQRRHSVIKDAISRAKETGDASDSNVLWPNKTSVQSHYTLAWVATTNRYFGLAVHRAVDDPDANKARSLDQVDRVEMWLNSPVGRLSEINEDVADSLYMNLKLIGNEMAIASGQTRRLDLGVYAGPLRTSLLAKEQPYRAFSLQDLIVYQLSCAWCTFQWLTHFLLWFLRLIEGDVIFLGGLGIGVHDWAVAIIILVFFVRLLLHPLTKKGQVSMQRMSRGMSKLQPEIKKLQEKYKDNPKKLQQEQMALYREHNINPAGCLGTLPMFLQSPIWIALYAMLYFAIELRQQPAFYGVFQLFGNWSFLADLSQPDQFIALGHSILGSIPWAGPYLEKIPFIGGVSSINLLPILMGAIFFLQQKYLTPPNPNATPEQEQQQKIMKIVFPLVFPLMLYTAPSGLTLYIMTSSTLGILESRYIRAHIDSLDLDKDAKPSAARPTKKVPNRAEKFRKER